MSILILSSLSSFFSSGFSRNKADAKYSDSGRISIVMVNGEQYTMVEKCAFCSMQGQSVPINNTTGAVMGETGSSQVRTFSFLFSSFSFSFLFLYIFLLLFLLSFSAFSKYSCMILEHATICRNSGQ